MSPSTPAAPPVPSAARDRGDAGRGPWGGRRAAWVLAAAWAMAAWLLLTTPPPPPAALPPWMPASLLAWLPSLDKLGHAGLFFVQALLLDRALAAPPGGSRRGALAWSIALVALLGAATELRQAWVPGRTADVLDLLADLAGGLAYAALAALIRRRPW